MKLISRILLGVSALMALGFIALIGAQMASPEVIEGSPLEAWGVSYILMAVAAITFTVGIVLMLRERSSSSNVKTSTVDNAQPASNPEIGDWTPDAAPVAPPQPEIAAPQRIPESDLPPGWTDAKTPIPSNPNMLSKPDSGDDAPWAQNTPEPFSPQEPARPQRLADSQPTPRVPQPVPSPAKTEASLESNLSSSGAAQTPGPDSDSAFQAAPWMIQPTSPPRPTRAETPTPKAPERVKTPTPEPPPRTKTPAKPAAQADQGLARSPSGQERLSQDQLRARLSRLRNQLDPAEPAERVSSTGDKSYKSSLRASPDNAFDVPTRRVGNAEIADVVSRSERSQSSSDPKLLHGLPRSPFTATLGDLGPTKLNALWHEYIEANHACGRDLSRLKPEAFYKHLAQNYKAIVERFDCNSVRFSIKTKDNRVSLQAVPIRRKPRA